MQLTSFRLLPTNLDTAWRALNDPEALKAAIPGCESMERTADNEYTAVVIAAVGPVKAKFRGKLRLSDVVPPESYTLHFEGQGGPAGHSKGSAKVRLAPEGGQTRMDYQVSAQVGGRIAQVGQRLIDAAAAKVADDFFATFSANLAPKSALPLQGEVRGGSHQGEGRSAPSISIQLIGAILMAILVALPFVLR